MIKNIIELLGTDNFYNVSEEIDFAKGKYKAPETIREGIKNIKRQLRWQSKRK